MNLISIHFGKNDDGRLLVKLGGAMFEIELYLEDGHFGGWSSYYCSKTWNEETLENEADLEIFDLLLKIDTQNGADPSKIVLSLCLFGAFEAVKVRKT